MDTIEINRKKEIIDYDTMANTGPKRDIALSSRLIIWLPFKPTFFKYLFDFI